MARVFLRLSFDDDKALGPGKVRLLEEIAERGSISGAGRAMHMSYRRAWDLVDDLNRTFHRPLVAAQPGGSGGGGAMLTPTGREVIRLYRAIEADAARGANESIAALEALCVRRSRGARKR